MKDVPETFPEPPDAQGPDDGERQGGFEGSLPDDPEADEELHEREGAVGEHRIVIDVRGVPGDRVRDPAGVARGEVVEHAAEPVRPPGEHERLELQNGIEEPDRCQDQLKRPLEVPRLLNRGGRDPPGVDHHGWRIAGPHLGHAHRSPPSCRAHYYDR